MIILFSSLFIVAVIYLFQRRYATKDALIFYLFVFIKVISAILVGLLYQAYYEISGDTFSVFYQAKAWYELLLSGNIDFFQWIGVSVVDVGEFYKVLPTEPRTRFFTFFVSYLMPFSASNYYLVAVWMTLFPIMGLWILTQAIIDQLKVSRWLTYASLLFLPSVIFWSAGLLKETLMIALVAAILSLYMQYRKTPIKSKMLFLARIILAALILYQFKYYVVIVLMPILVITDQYLYRKGFRWLSFLSRRTWYIITLITGVLILAIAHPVFNSGLFFELLQLSHDQIALGSGENNIHFQAHENSILFTCLNAPLALFSGLFRPFIWEAHHMLSLFAAIESSLFTLCFVGAIYSLFKIDLTNEQKWWLMAVLIYVIALATIICLSTPNFGTLVRYRIAYMPFCWFTCLWLIDSYLYKWSRKK